MKPVLAAGAALALLLIVPLAGAQTIEGPPTYTDGDAWTREATVESGSATFHLRQHTVYAGTEEISVNGTSYEAIVMDSDSKTTVTSGNRTFTQYSNSTQWMRSSDQALIKTETHVTVVGGPQGQQSYNSSRVYHEPCVTFDWPLEVGKTWDSVCTATTTTNGQQQTQTQEEHYRVVRAEEVEVPAGTFQTLVVENATEEEDDRQVQWYSEAACGPAKIRTDSGGQTFEIDLTQVTCQATGASGGGSMDGGDGGDGGMDGGDGGAGGQDANGSPGPGALLVGLVVVAAAQALRRR